MNKRSISWVTVVVHLLVFGCSHGNAQSLTHTVAIRISPTQAGQLTAAFTSVRPANDFAFAHTDITTCRVTGDSLISGILGLPSVLHGLGLRPMYPTHSIVFPDIRSHANPSLFSNKLITSQDDNALNVAEDKVSRWFILTYRDSTAPETAVAIARKSNVIEVAEPRYIRRSQFTPNDPHVGEQFGLGLMHVPEAWDLVRCDSTMLLAVDDVGTDWSHEDLEPSIATNWGEIGIDSNGIDKRANGIDDDGNGYIDDWHGWDFAGANGDAPDNDSRSPDDHGTHTGGIMAAAGNNGKGIAGVAFGARLLPLKTAGDYSGSLDFAFQGVIYAADMHAKAVNCSFGGYNYAQAEQDAVSYAVSKGCAIVAASGNDSSFRDVYPAAYQFVLGVGASTASGGYASYADYNTHVSVFAPGGEAGQKIISTLPGNQYGGEYGTSMASPQACGVVGLVRQRFPWMNALQACQQVRATAVPQVVDSAHRGFVGHGLVNALAAVTDTNARSARIERVNIADDIGLGHFVAGESGGIVLTVHNYLKPVRDLWATLEVIEGSSAISLNQTSVFFGQAGMDQLVENVQASLRLTVLDDVAANTRVTIRVTFNDTLVHYGPDMDYFSFIVGPTYLDLNANNLTVTFSSFGSIGYNDPIADNQGSGFQWRNPPANIGPLARNVLFNGGLMIGSDSQHVVDVVLANSNSADRDFSPTQTIANATPDHGAAQELVCKYSDAIADAFNRVGVTVTQRAYAFTQGLTANAAVVQYILRHAPDATTNDPLAAAVYMDWDVGLSGAVNITRVDSLKHVAVTYRLEPNYPYVGVALLSPAPEGSVLNYHAIRNDGSQGDINTYGGFDREQKWRAMTEFFPTTGPGDVSMVMGLKNLTLAQGDSLEMTLVFALAQTSDLLDETIDTVKTLWLHSADVAQTATQDHSISVYPNPFGSRLHVSWPHSGLASVAIYDALGREIATNHFVGSNGTFGSLRLPAGIYTIEVATGSERYGKTVVSNGLF